VRAAKDTGLLIIDMISSWDFPDADKLLPVVRGIGDNISAAALKQFDEVHKLPTTPGARIRF